VKPREYPDDPTTDERVPPLRPVITPPTGNNLVSEYQAAYHLRIVLPPSDEVEADLQQKLVQASDAIRDYLKSGNDPAWAEADGNVPSIVQAATLLYLTNLWEHRGDDGAPNDADAACWEAIKRLLIRQRDPALA
jgi:hypothetical protein